MLLNVGLPLAVGVEETDELGVTVALGETLGAVEPDAVDEALLEMLGVIDRLPLLVPLVDGDAEELGETLALSLKEPLRLCVSVVVRVKDEVVVKLGEGATDPLPLVDVVAVGEELELSEPL